MWSGQLTQYPPLDPTIGGRGVKGGGVRCTPTRRTKLIAQVEGFPKKYDTWLVRWFIQAYQHKPPL